jgi:hypothetical protein
MMSGIVATLTTVACKPTPPSPELQVVGESTRIRLENPFPTRSPWFDGAKLSLFAARGETLGLQVLQREPQSVSLRFEDAAIHVRGFAVESFRAHHGSTAMYGGTQGAGTYPDALMLTEAPATNPAYLEIVVAREATPGVRTGELIVGERRFPATIEIAPATLPPLPPYVWAYGDPRELVWASSPTGDPPRAKPSAAELACVETFRAHGVLLTPDVHLDWWPERKHLLAGLPDVPVNISNEPDVAREQVRRWIELTEGTGQVPFAIPIDEPRTPELRAKVKALAQAVRDAGGGPGRFHYAVTDVPREEYGDLVDLYISPNAAHRTGDRYRRWTYNGSHPAAGSMVLDAITPGMRTWGWIAWRYDIPTWYVWDALYWHDRHNRDGAPLPGRALDPRIDPVSFDDGEDRGNLDGVLALPSPEGCQPTLRLAQLRRGMQDRQLLELAGRCDAEAAEALAAKMIPNALADAPGKGRASAASPSWPTTELPWEEARRQLLRLASCDAAAR